MPSACNQEFRRTSPPHCFEALSFNACLPACALYLFHSVIQHCLPVHQCPITMSFSSGRQGAAAGTTTTIAVTVAAVVLAITDTVNQSPHAPTCQPVLALDPDPMIVISLVLVIRIASAPNAPPYHTVSTAGQTAHASSRQFRTLRRAKSTSTPSTLPSRQKMDSSSMVWRVVNSVQLLVPCYNQSCREETECSEIST